MKTIPATTRGLRLALTLSLLFNAGVVAALVWRSLPSPEPVVGAGASLPRHLELDAEQRQRWHAAEAEVRAHRDRMIAEIFAAAPDLAHIDGERAAISRLQDEQQRLVVGQLLRERELLTPAQREKLARLLSEQPVGPSSFERLHRD